MSAPHTIDYTIKLLLITLLFRRQPDGRLFAETIKKTVLVLFEPCYTETMI